MGCGGSKEEGGGGGSAKDAAADLKSKQLEEEMEKAQQEEDRIVKLLVLGTGESGKSTVFKQMKILYSVPDPPHKFIMICRANLFGNAHTVCEGMKRLKIEFGSSAAEEASNVVLAVPPDGNPDNIGDLAAPLKTMYQDSGVQQAIERAAEYQLNDSTIYFWERAEEVCKTDYMPSEQDVLRARVRTTGIVQQNFQIKDKKYTMFDVGGQRNERRKWIHCFDNVTAVIFVTAISEYDQVLYEDENTNRMDEALLLFEQICNHPSFKKTSMILFLNKRDLFQAKLAKKDMSCWRDLPELQGNRDYDSCIEYIQKQFLMKNKDPENRQIYCHATCATDTNNVSFVMESVFDVILKDNLRKLAVGNVESLLELCAGAGESQVKTGDEIWKEAKSGKIILSACFFVDTLSERKVCVNEKDSACLPSVQVGEGLSISATDWDWIMGLGKNLPVLPVYDAEAGSFRGDFKKACQLLRQQVGTDDLGFVYDSPCVMTNKTGSRITIIPCVKRVESSAMAIPGGVWVEHEAFENACYKKFDNKDTDSSPCRPPDKNAEFNPFAPNPVGYRWFKGITLFEAAVAKVPDKGVYLGVFKVLNSSGGFKVMVNEHNRVNIPIIFLTENQLNADEMEWMHGVRCREQKFGIDLLEGQKPNMGWLGPEMSGEDGATFKEKLWWAKDEAASRMSLEKPEDLGVQYDKELLFIDERNNIQLLLYGQLAKDATDCLPGHIWVDKQFLLQQNMKYYCPKVLQGMLGELQDKVDNIQKKAANDSLNMAQVATLREEKKKMTDDLKVLLTQQTPLKWVDRVIMWCADKMPSFCENESAGDATSCVKSALAKATDVKESAAKREALIKKYG